MRKLTDLVEEVPGLNSLEAFMLYRLADRANEQRICWPSIRKLSEEMRVGRREVLYLLLALEEMGLIHRQSVRGSSSTITLLIEQALEKPDLGKAISSLERDRGGHVRRRSPEPVELTGHEKFQKRLRQWKRQKA